MAAAGRDAPRTHAEPPAALALHFTLLAGRWVDLDTLAETTLRGLADAGLYAAGFGQLDGFLATKRFGGPTGALLTALDRRDLDALEPPGSAQLDARGDVAPRQGRRDDKRAWRAALAAAWGGRPALTGAVWADVTFGGAGSVLGALEPVLDALEPCLGRDPRGRDWQEFFPRDDLVVWLRVHRDRAGPAVRLRLGPVDDSAFRAIRAAGR